MYSLFMYLFVWEVITSSSTYVISTNRFRKVYQLHDHRHNSNNYFESYIFYKKLPIIYNVEKYITSDLEFNLDVILLQLPLVKSISSIFYEERIFYCEAIGPGSVIFHTFVIPAITEHSIGTCIHFYITWNISFI